FDVAGRTKGNSNHVFVNGEQALHYLRASTAGELLEDSNVIAVPDNAATKVFQDDTRVAIWSKVPCAQAHPYTMRWRYRMTRRANE
ncbi:MAG: hypothetical protein MI725_09715, partial [Pirellulales bacterium]|nr:hypothetical protein [Pirellulales bacterium]